MAKSTRNQTRKTARAPARAGGAKTVAKSTSKTKRAAARPAAKSAKPAKSAPARKAINGTPVAARKAGKNAKAAPEKKAGKRGSRIDVKTSTFGGTKPGSFGFGGSGGGSSFLSGKPGSGGAGGSDQPPARLTRTRLSTRDLRHFRDLLLAKRRQLLGDMETMENEALRTDTTNLSHLPVHMADMGTDNYEQEFTLSLVDRDRQLVDAIHAALRKIDEKTYGICEGTGQMISRERLEAQPWARYSIEYARQLQRPGVRR